MAAMKSFDAEND